MNTLLIMAGGTGGHIMPGLAVAEHMKSLGWNVVWMGNPDGMEARLVPKHGIEMSWVRFGALRGKGLLRKLMLPLNLLRACSQARNELKRVRPDVVLGMGGFITFPGGMMAKQLGIPLVLHEQNSIPGLANKVLAKMATRVLSGFPDALPKAEWVGNPVRVALTELPSPSQRFDGRQPPLHLLVVGGSLGAASLNTMIPAGLALLPESERPKVRHQAGEKHLQSLIGNYTKAGVEAECSAFIDDMAAAYAWADIVICRAGALTVAELAAVGIGSVLVPYPHAVDDHQTTNARFLANAGAAILLPQSELSPEKLSLIRHLSRAQLLQMAERARDLARPDAAKTVAKICIAVAKKG
ncbi:MAG TPA: undecaprenyldiphospho-muramoylpentapeptide beta-N-acetylglucosaminyltransferase [Rhodocyclaceae bacterium]|jgi:UDP-N-acetylglucosamine--N-acetylmuramyl-(pentapeptide) pyrophosphoryl-undecaprenol N-acetylglucosamine transferase|nr:undecaprenyldiphospho-muramoylpentapeptide beta-N-acetylglucosaminyltransferase [Rhodocyclaceae bacterium]